MSKITVLKNKEDFKLCPKGTKLKVWMDRFSHTSWTVAGLGVDVVGRRIIEECLMVEVDFSSIEPLYPHKGLKVPKNGIPFANGSGLLYDCADNRFYCGDDSGFYCGAGGVTACNYYSFGSGRFELEQALPETIEVDSPDTKRKSGYYWVVFEGRECIAKYDSCKRMLSVCGYTPIYSENNFNSIDWDNPITKGAK